MQTEMKKFKQLAMGQWFRFASEETMPYSGMERGPWQRTGKRAYEKRGMRCTVGTINVEVIPMPI